MSTLDYRLDPARTVRLPDSSWRAAVGVGTDGTESLWLVSPGPVEAQEVGCACATCAPHEQDPAAPAYRCGPPAPDRQGHIPSTTRRTDR